MELTHAAHPQAPHAPALRHPRDPRRPEPPGDRGQESRTSSSSPGCSQDEVERRAQKQLGLRLRRAAFDATKTLEGFDFSFNPTLNKAQIFDLATCQFVERHENRLALRARRASARATSPRPSPTRRAAAATRSCFVSTAKMLAHLHGGRADGTYERRLATLPPARSPRPRRLRAQAAARARPRGPLRRHQRAVRAGLDRPHEQPRSGGVGRALRRTLARLGRPRPTHAPRPLPRDHRCELPGRADQAATHHPPAREHRELRGMTGICPTPHLRSWRLLGPRVLHAEV